MTDPRPQPSARLGAATSPTNPASPPRGPWYWVTLAVGVWLADRTSSGISAENPLSLALAVVALSAAHHYLRPTMVLFTLPFIALTFGLGMVLIEAVLFWLVGAVLGSLGLGFTVASLWSGLWGALVVLGVRLLPKLPGFIRALHFANATAASATGGHGTPPVFRIQWRRVIGNFSDQAARSWQTSPRAPRPVQPASEDAGAPDPAHSARSGNSSANSAATPRKPPQRPANDDVIDI